tara:strand:+ start:1844 stop:2518 length:675 start_codon:yes stop_codon:yes gene_type:complete
MRQSGRWGAVVVVVLAVAVVIMVSGLLAKGRVEDARESIVALEDSLALRDSVVAVYRSQNVRDSTLLAQRDSAVAADTVAWRQEREALVVRAETADSRAASRARALRPSLSPTQAAAMDTILAGKDSTIAFQTERADNAETALAEVTDLYSAAQQLMAGLNAEMGLLRADKSDLEAIVEEQRIEIDWYKNPPLAQRLKDAIPGGTTGLLVGALATYLLVSVPSG